MLFGWIAANISLDVGESSDLDQHGGPQIDKARLGAEALG
jgi:hypothetical protein